MSRSSPIAVGSTLKRTRQTPVTAARLNMAKDKTRRSWWGSRTSSYSVASTMWIHGGPPLGNCANTGLAAPELESVSIRQALMGPRYKPKLMIKSWKKLDKIRNYSIHVRHVDVHAQESATPRRTNWERILIIQSIIQLGEPQ
jgi:hypothetical protein